MPLPREELLYPHTHPTDRVPRASAVRGTVIVSSLRGLKSRGHGDAYWKLLDPRFHSVVESLTAASWQPVEFALAHYDACDRLGLERATIEDIGAESGRFVNQTVLAVVAKLSVETGLTPWFALANANKLIARTWVGSSMAVWKLGPKEARVELIQQPAAVFPYFRIAFGAFTAAICGHFSKAMYTRELRSRSPDTEVGYRMSWV